jgi:NADP-dependent 3-hydroxy acid dehydrogenase YdfG
MQIEDRVFIVTGASSGIGESTAIALSKHGAKVALLARSADALQKLAQQYAAGRTTPRVRANCRLRLGSGSGRVPSGVQACYV